MCPLATSHVRNGVNVKSEVHTQREGEGQDRVSGSISVPGVCHLGSSVPPLPFLLFNYISFPIM